MSSNVIAVAAKEATRSRIVPSCSADAFAPAVCAAAGMPISISLTGSYHQFGEFVSGIAALPRIVTLHDIEIKSINKDAYDQLTLELTAKTYRYLDEDELAAGDSKSVTHRPRPGG